MRIMVAGDIKNPVLLDTDKATALLVETDDGKPAMVLQMLPNGNGFIRITKGEDKNFDQIAKELGLT